ncbi:MAG: sigma-E factor negative regulatory protein [Proteobacteria bacterium]|nr:sigma-E factor negative regulatory protein [Pseudomonadota bacterium]
MREKISQWMDGEGGEDASRSVYMALKSDAGHETWVLYHLIGDALRDGGGGAQYGVLSAGFTARVMQALEAETAAPMLQETAAPQKTTPPEKNTAGG